MREAEKAFIEQTEVNVTVRELVDEVQVKETAMVGEPETIREETRIVEGPMKEIAEV